MELGSTAESKEIKGVKVGGRCHWVNLVRITVSCKHSIFTYKRHGKIYIFLVNFF